MSPMAEQDPGFWRVLRPAAWPEPPEWMSFSTLLELEACPRRWALRAADFPGGFEWGGYPPPLSRAAIEGTVVHRSLQKVSAALVECGAPSLSDERAVEALRELGGYTTVVLGSLKETFKQVEGNPRAGPVLERTRQELRARVPGIRARVQRHLARIQPEARTRTARNATGLGAIPSQGMLHGSYAEVDLRADDLGWHGIADLITVSRTVCEIRDFKTGAWSPQHELQLRTYALLWARDGNLNPDGRVASRLVLSYEEGEQEVPAPNEEELLDLENELRRRAKEAVSDVRAKPPQARPSQENCGYCPVRHLCEEYWEWLCQDPSIGESGIKEWTDVQIKVLGPHGPRSWDGVVEGGRRLRIGESILLRLGGDLPFQLCPGNRVRLLRVGLTLASEEPTEEGDSDSVAVATMSLISEAFLLK